MHVVRLRIVAFLVLGILFTYSPLVREEVSQSWEQIRPGVILVMDDLYAVVRNLVAGSGEQDGIEDTAPGVEYDFIITMDRRDSA
jgi:hypothetical protein